MLYVVVKPDDDEIKAAMFKDNKLRLLMTLVGFMRLGTDEDPEASWIIPSNVSSETLESMKWKVEHAVNEGGPEIEEGKSAEDYLRRKRKVDYDDDTEGSSGDEDFLFPAGGPTARKSDEQDGSDEAPKRRRRLKRRDAEQELDDEEEDRRRKAREEAQKEKLRKIKSNLYVDSDDEEDDEEKDKEFFAREEQLRKNTREHIMKALSEAEVNSKPSKKRKSTGADKGNRKKSKVASEDEEDVSANDTEEDDDLIETRVARRSSPAEITLEDEDNDSEMTDTPLSSPHADAPATERPSKIGEVMPLRTTLALDKQNSVFDEDSDEDLPVRTQRRNVRGGFVIDSDSE